MWLNSGGGTKGCPLNKIKGGGDMFVIFEKDKQRVPIKVWLEEENRALY
jgi:hypothetical protein